MRICLRLLLGTLAVLVAVNANESAVAQELIVHNLTHENIQAFEADEGAAPNIIKSGATGVFDAFAGVPWHFKADVGFVGVHMVRDVARDTVYVTSYGIFAINDIVVIKRGDGDTCLSARGLVSLKDPASWWYVREGENGQGVAFESAAGGAGQQLFGATWDLIPHPFHHDEISLVSVDKRHKLVFSRGTPELAPAGAASPSSLRIIREIDSWFSEYQPGRGLKGQGKVTSKSQTEGFTGQLIAVDRHCRWGYNVLKMNPFDLQQRGTLSAGPPLIDEYHPDQGETYYLRSVFRVPKNLLWTDANNLQADVTETMYRSRAELNKGFSVSVDVKGGSAKSGVGANGNYESKHSKMDENESFLKVGTKWGSHMWLTLDKELVRLDAKFVSFLGKLDPEKYDGNALRPGFKQLFEQFGTHYAMSSLFGGRAVLEEEMQLSKIAESAAETIGGGVEGTAKGVSVGVNVSFSEESKSETSNSMTRHTFYRGGGTGGTFDGWDVGEAKDWVPIKVDLHPVYELIRPELVLETCSPQLARRLTALRLAGPKMLAQYLEEGKRATEFLAAREPMVFEATFDHAKCVESDDQSGQPDLYGTMKMGFYRTEGETQEPSAGDKKEPLALSKLWEIEADGEADEDGTISKTDVEAQQVAAGDSPLSEEEKQRGQPSLVISVLPEVQSGKLSGEQVFQVSFPLKNYSFDFQYDLVDWDPGADTDETMSGSKSVSFDEIVWEDDPRRYRSGPYVFKFTTEKVSGFGKMEFQFTLRRVNYHLLGQEDSLPDFPKFKSQ